MKKFLFCVAMAAAVATVAMAGGRTQTATTEVRVNPPGTFPIVDEQVTIDVWTTFGATGHDGNYQAALFTQWFEDLTNVRINFVEIVEANNLAERLNLVLSSGDLPDTFMNEQMLTHQQVFTNGLFGNFIPVDDLIDDWMPNLSARLADHPEYARQLIMPDGKRYAFPTVEANCYHCSMSRKMWVYMPWLEQLGLDVPETTEEFYEMLVAFRDGDPNQTGKSDTIPLTTAATGAWRGGPLSEFLMSSFIYTNVEHFLKRNGNSLQFVANTSEWREGIRYMNRLYREGLLMPDSFTQDRNQLVSLVESPGPAVVGAVNAGWYGVFSVNSWDGSGRFADFHPISPLAGPTGLRQTVYAPTAAVPHTVITRNARHPEVIARLNDWFYESYETIMIGDRWEMPIQGGQWTTPEMLGTASSTFRFLTQDELATGNFLGRDGSPATSIQVREMQSFAEDRSWDGWRRLSPMWSTGGGNAMPLEWADDPTKQEWRLAQATRELYEPFRVDHHMPGVLVVDEQVQDELADLQITLIGVAGSPGIVQQFYAEFVTGARNINSDNEWNAYVRQLERAGVARYVEILENALQAGVQ